MKKMKLYTSKVVIAVMSILILSCSDFLEIDNPTVVTDDYYDTKEGQERLIMDMYSQYREVYSNGVLQFYGTDMYTGVGEGMNERMFNGYDKTFNSTAGVVPEYWKVLYKIVQEGNTLLNRCSEEVAGTDYGRMTAEARFMRALAYYYLVETFGPVPLLTDEVSDIILQATRVSEEELYSFIITELEDVKGMLPDNPSSKGRLSNSALRHFLGKIYLTRAYKPFGSISDFEKSATELEYVINDTESGLKLLEKFEDIFDIDNQGNEEVIWSIQYGTDKIYSGGGNPQHLWFGFSLVALYSKMFGYVQSDYSAMHTGYWILPNVHEWFTDPIADSRYDASFTREFYINQKDHENYGKLGIYFPRWNDESGNDQGAQIFVPFRKDSKYNWYPQSAGLDEFQNVSGIMPIVRKFREPKIEWGGKGTREDIVIRMGDTYLLASEAHLGAGSTTKALGRLNDIRRRASVDSGSRSQMEMSTVDIDIILDERARELLGEHDRWFDLKRTGKLIERAMQYNPYVKKYDNLNAIHLVRPIPQDERNKVEGLGQNEGY